MTMQTPPTPWTMRLDPNGKTYTLFDADGQVITDIKLGSVERSRATAEMIMATVNTLDDFDKALDAALSDMAPEGIVAADYRDELRMSANMLATYAPEIFPDVDEHGRVHFGRALMDAAAEAIRRALDAGEQSR